MYTCGLIEFIARKTKNHRYVVVDCLGEDIERIYEYQDVFHCEVTEKVADDFINRNNISYGNFDNISQCEYRIPSNWDIGKVFENLIEDLFDEDNVFVGLREVYHSWLAEEILNFNSDLYYQPRSYLAECYKSGKILL